MRRFAPSRAVGGTAVVLPTMGFMRTSGNADRKSLHESSDASHESTAYANRGCGALQALAIDISGMSEDHSCAVPLWIE